MKELSIEEKAKRYDEAIEKAEKWHNAPNVDKIPTFGNRIIEDIFPELKESDDERIRKELTDYIKSKFENSCSPTPSKNILSNWIAWLEKQGEQKSVDKVEPKFKVGDWVVFENRHQSIYQVEKIEDGYYILRHTHGGTFRICVLHDDSLRLWTIQDAKDGDVLANAKSVFIYAKVLYNKPYAHCGVDKFGVFKDDCLKYDWSNSVDNIHPATKEQHDLLFQKMKEAGYEWNVDKRY